MPLSRAALECIFYQPPPRMADEEVYMAALNLYLPKLSRMLLLFVALFMMAILCASTALFISKGRYGGEWRMLREPPAVAEGVVQNVEARKGAKGSVTYVYAFEFQPVQASPRTVQGFCFSGTALAEKGGRVVIEYLAADTSIARIRGARLNPLSPGVLIFLPLNGLLMMGLVFGFIGYRKAWVRDILRQGIVVPATISAIKKGPKNATSIIVSFALRGQSRTAKAQLALGKKQLALMTSRHEAGKQVAALAHPVKTQRVFILDLIMPEEQV